MVVETKHRRQEGEKCFTVVGLEELTSPRISIEAILIC